MNNINLIRKSLDHWLDNLCLIENGCVPDISSQACALCNVYLDDNCLDCPLYHIGKGCCEEGSPYNIIESYFYKMGLNNNIDYGDKFPSWANHKKFLKLALDMTQVLEFLSLGSLRGVMDALEKGGE